VRGLIAATTVHEMGLYTKYRPGFLRACCSMHAIAVPKSVAAPNHCGLPSSDPEKISNFLCITTPNLTPGVWLLLRSTRARRDLHYVV